MNTAAALRTVDLGAGPCLERDTVTALGNFDGVHLAHRELLLATCKKAQDLGCIPAVFCFDPPSSDYLSPGSAGHLTTLEEKLSLFAACGIRRVYLASFPDLRAMAPEDFVTHILTQQCRAHAVVCGFHFRFGQGGRGDGALLDRLLGEERVTHIPPYRMPVGDQMTVVSASVIRSALLSGDIGTANRLLGRAYHFSAPVVYGKQLGRTLGTPTINQYAPAGKLLPADGIYVTRVLVDGTWYGGVSNVGHRPSVEDDHALNCETYLLDFDRQVYGQTVTVEFWARLREERRFSSVDELKAAIEGDISAAKDYFKQNEFI